jgi:hypothetical protein
MILLLNYKVSFQQFNIAQLHVQHFQFEDKFVVGLGQVGLVRLSDVPLHASTAQLGATSSPFFSNPHSTVFLSIDEFPCQCLPYSPHSLLDTNTDYYL